MLVASKESIARVRGYRSPLLAVAIISMFAYLFTSCWLASGERAAERELAEPLLLDNGTNKFAADSDGVFVLVKRHYSNSIMDQSTAGPQGSGQGNSTDSKKAQPDFDLSISDGDAISPAHLLWLAYPEEDYANGEYLTAYAALYLHKGQQVVLNLRGPKALSEGGADLYLARLGVRLGYTIYEPDHMILAARGLWGGTTLSHSNFRLASEELEESDQSRLDLPVPLLRDPAGLKLKSNLMPGERIKSSMVQLPTSESELVKFLAERNIDVIERAAAVK